MATRITPDYGRLAAALQIAEHCLTHGITPRDVFATLVANTAALPLREAAARIGCYATSLERWRREGHPIPPADPAARAAARLAAEAIRLAGLNDGWHSHRRYPAVRRAIDFLRFVGATGAVSCPPVAFRVREGMSSEYCHKLYREFTPVIHHGAVRRALAAHAAGPATAVSA